MKFLMILKYVLLVMLAITGIRLIIFVLGYAIGWIAEKLRQRRIRKLNEKYGYDDEEEVLYY